MRAKHARVSSMYKQITYTHKYTHEHMNRYRDRERQGEKQTNKYEKIQKERGEKERDPSISEDGSEIWRVPGLSPGTFTLGAWAKTDFRVVYYRVWGLGVQGLGFGVGQGGGGERFKIEDLLPRSLLDSLGVYKGVPCFLKRPFQGGTFVARYARCIGTPQLNQPLTLPGHFTLACL